MHAIDSTVEIQWCDGGAHWKAVMAKDGGIRMWISDGEVKQEMDAAAVQKFRRMFTDSLKAVGYCAFDYVSKIWDATAKKEETAP